MPGGVTNNANRAENKTPTQAFAVRWSEIKRWNPNSFREISWNWPLDTIKPLSIALKRRIAPVALKRSKTELVFGSLHFDGELSKRNMSGKTDVKGKLFSAFPDDVVYSKIDVRNGAIGVIPKVTEEMVFSSEFPIYKVDKGNVLPEYIKLLFRTESFLYHINSLVSGASGRKRVEPSTMEEIQVPLPSLAIQRAIIAPWRAASDAVTAAEEKCRAIAIEVEEMILGNRPVPGFESLFRPPFHPAPSSAPNKCLSLVKWSEMERWDPQSFDTIHWAWPNEVMAPIGSFLETRREKIDRKKVSFSELCPISIHFDGSISKRNVTAGKEYTMDLFYARPGDIVVSKIDLKNGAVGILPDNWENVAVTGHFVVYKANLTRIVPEYFHRLIQASAFKTHLWKNKVGAEGRKEVKIDFLESQKIPLPPLVVQQAILAPLLAAQTHLSTAKAHLHRITRETEEMILGRRPVSLNR